MVAPRRVEQAGPNTNYLETLAKRIREALVGGLRADYELGKLVWEVKRGGYWHREDWPGAPEGGYADSKSGFAEWAWDVLGKKIRAVDYHERNYRLLSEMNLVEDSDLFHRALKLGWSKLAHVLPMCKTPQDMAAWLDKIEKEKMTENTLRTAAKLHRASLKPPEEAPDTTADEDDDDDDAAEPPVSQAPARPAAAPAVMVDAAGNHRDVAGNRIDPDTGEILETVAIAKPDTNVKFALTFENTEAAKIFWSAIDVIKKRGALSNGEAAARMAQYYLASTTHDDEGGVVTELEKIILDLEKVYGVRLVLAPQEREPVGVGVSVGADADAATEGFSE